MCVCVDVGHCVDVCILCLHACAIKEHLGLARAVLLVQKSIRTVQYGSARP